MFFFFYFVLKSLLYYHQVEHYVVSVMDLQHHIKVLVEGSLLFFPTDQGSSQTLYHLAIPL